MLETSSFHCLLHIPPNYFFLIWKNWSWRNWLWWGPGETLGSPKSIFGPSDPRKFQFSLSFTTYSFELIHFDLKKLMLMGAPENPRDPENLFLVTLVLETSIFHSKWQHIPLNYLILIWKNWSQRNWFWWAPGGDPGPPNVKKSILVPVVPETFFPRKILFYRSVFYLLYKSVFSILH